MPDSENGAIIMAPLYLASVNYYAIVAGAPRVILDTAMRFDKRHKAMHRCTINDANSTMQLTVPVEKLQSMSHATWADVMVSGHDRWWERHITALQSAYGRTPFFEFYIDDFLKIINEQAVGQPLVNLTTSLNALLCRLLGITTPVDISNNLQNFHALPACNLIDMRGRQTAMPVENVEYYQTWALKRGFTPGMSVVDLLFNMGPESPLILSAMMLPKL